MPESGRVPAVPFLMSICLIAISSDFFEIFLPNPVLSTGVAEGLTGFRERASDPFDTLRISLISPPCPFASKRPLDGDSTLPLETVGDAGRLDTFTGGDGASSFPLAGRDLPAESGLSERVVLRLGGVSREKSGREIGCGGALTLGLGELGRESDRGAGDEGAGEREGAELLRVGVEGRESCRVEGILEAAGICGLEVGVEGLEL